MVQIYGLVQDYSNPSALAMELLQYCTKPSKYSFETTWAYLWFLYMLSKVFRNLRNLKINPSNVCPLSSVLWWFLLFWGTGIILRHWHVQGCVIAAYTYISVFYNDTYTVPCCKISSRVIFLRKMYEAIKSTVLEETLKWPALPLWDIMHCHWEPFTSDNIETQTFAASRGTAY